MNNCEEIKKILGKYWKCCPICHSEPWEREMGVFEHYTKIKGLLFEACCSFMEIEDSITDKEWEEFEKKLEEKRK